MEVLERSMTARDWRQRAFTLQNLAVGLASDVQEQYFQRWSSAAFGHCSWTIGLLVPTQLSASLCSTSAALLRRDKLPTGD